jgi:hypothetical protein
MICAPSSVKIRLLKMMMDRKLRINLEAMGSLICLSRMDSNFLKTLLIQFMT